MKPAIFDISQLLEPGLAVWPGDTPLTVTRNLLLKEGASVNLSDIRLSLHSGTHADAPGHYLPEGRGIESADLSAFLGRARVVAIPKGGNVSVDILQCWDWRETPRCLLKTGSAPNRRQFDTGFMPLSEEVARFLVAQGACLVGTDAPSVDAFDSKLLPVHHILGSGGVAILESLELSQVPEGEYELIALPLKLVGLDASPVRAILRTL